MNREVHVRIWERVGVKFPRATRYTAKTDSEGTSRSEPQSYLSQDRNPAFPKFDSGAATGNMRAYQMSGESVEQRVNVLRQTIVALVRRAGPDLSARQLGVFLTCDEKDEAQTVRGLAADLKVSKPAITRALDRLGEFDLVHRKTAPLAASPG